MRPLPLGRAQPSLCTLPDGSRGKTSVGRDRRGRGLCRGVEFVADRATKAPFEPSLGVAGKVKKAAFAEGLICYPMPGTRDGRHGDHVLLAPPFIATEAELDEMVDRLARAVDRVLSGL